MALERSSGLLLHITSLPSYGGIGDFGPAAYAFADFLAAAKQRLWQVLPLSPTGYGNSPYAALSAFAGNPLLISLEKLVEAGWIAADRIVGLPGPWGNVRFEEVEQRKWPLLLEAAQNFLSHHDDQQWGRFQRFREENAFWLPDYVRYSVLRQRFHSGAWASWPKDLAHRESNALLHLQQESRDDLEVQQAIQFAFDEQWKALRAYCAKRDIRFIGDVAIFVSYDSADVWTHPEIFELHQDLTPIRVAGVPPDYFSETGQRWGNPIYKWDVLQSRRFDWWVDRMRRAHALYDIIRLDHFRGFEAFWAIPAEDETAIHGEWVKAPGGALFTALHDQLGPLPLIAEDLGLITREVDALREQFDLPGMRVLQFAFTGRGARNYLPHRYVTNTVVYTGTHDNDTTLGWWQHGATEGERTAVYIYLNPAPNDVVWTLMRAASTSVADVCLFPVQDVLVLGSEARMNTPARPENNWTWRMAPDALTAEKAKGLAQLAELTDRDGWVEAAKA
jgi:4-alpha-glucanotransferase